MHDRFRVLVVGTTADYIEWIRNSCPGQALFVTDLSIRQRAVEPMPGPGEEVLCDLRDPEGVLQALKSHMLSFRLSLAGITSFDCESMALAAFLAEKLHLSYPTMHAIQNCREKYASKTLWQEKGVHCPRFALVRSGEDALSFFREVEKPCVLKPTCGSGSELVYKCIDEASLRSNFHIIEEELSRRHGNRLYDASKVIIEEFVQGEEYSCDFMFDGEKAEVIRVTRKLKADDEPFGTIRSYLLPAMLPDEIAETLLPDALSRAVKALFLTRCICMTDFIIEDGRIVFLEMTPRPGGDCLPYLLKRSCGLDMLRLAVEFAAGQTIRLPDLKHLDPHIGLRIHAQKAGILKQVDAQEIRLDPRVLEVDVKPAPGDRIVLPPADYDSWLLGHIIFKPAPGADPSAECDALARKFKVEMEEAP